MFKKRIMIILMILVCLILYNIMSFFIKEVRNTKVQASSLFMGNGQTKVAMVFMDYIEISDIAEDEYLHKLSNKSYISLVSSRQIGKVSASKAKLTIGTGKRLLLTNTYVQAYNYPRQLEDFYQSEVELKKGNLFYQNIKELKQTNRNSEYLRYIGYLGDKLNSASKTTCVLGNSDTEIYNRNNLLIAMDSKGIVDSGDVENTILYDPYFPGGKRTDFMKLEELYKLNRTTSDFLVIDTGDLARLEHYRSRLTTEKYEELKAQTIKRISEFVKKIINNDNNNTTFLIVSAYPSASSIKLGDKLTPLISYTGSNSGLLYSKSTKREGIITNLDIADYILEKLNIREKSQLQEFDTEEPFDGMQKLNKRLLNTSVMRLPVLTWYAVFEIVCGIIGLLYMLNKRQIKNKVISSFVNKTLMVSISAPIVLLYMAVLYINNAAIYFIVFLILSYGIVYFISKVFKDSISRFAAIAFLVNVSLVIDLLRGSILIRSSILGYDPIIGARFYGIGNEFAGVYIGSSILLAGCLLHKFKDYVSRKPIAINIMLLMYFAAELYIIGMPSQGANFGGTIATVCGFYFFYSSIIGKRINIKQLILLGLILAIIISLIVFIDINNLSSTTHIGKFIIDTKENGVKVLYSTFIRKIEMNIKLIKYTIWTKVLLCIILIISIMFFKPVRLLYGIFKEYKHLTSAWLGISAASIVGLIVNDSGIVMAATAMIFTGYTILYMCLEEIEKDYTGG